MQNFKTHEIQILAWISGFGIIILKQILGEFLGPSVTF